MPRPLHGGMGSAYVHASPALLALKRGAVFFSLIVAIAIVGQALSFAFVHFTEARYEVPVAEKAAEQLAVVEAQPKKPASELSSDTNQVPERVMGKGDAVLAAVSNVASGIGVVALAVLVAQCWMATAIGAGAGVIGMQRTVRSATIATALFVSALPWTSAVPSAPIWGVFCGYEPLVAASRAANSGVRSELVVVMLHAVLPIVLLGFLVWAVFSLCVGVSAGIVKVAIDPVVEAEIAAVQQHGAGSLYVSRGTGDIERIASTPLAAPIRIASDNEADRALAELEKLAGRRRQNDEPLRPTGTDPLRRPI